MDEGLIPEDVRADIESGVAAALDEPDLRSAVERVGISGVPHTLNDVDLILMLVPRTHGAEWDWKWTGSDTFAPYVQGYIISTIEARDIAAGRSRQPLTEFQQGLLAKWEGQSGYQNR